MKDWRSTLVVALFAVVCVGVVLGAPPPPKSVPSRRHVCIHDHVAKLYKNRTVTTFQKYTAEAAWAPLRIAVDYRFMSFSDPAKGQFIQDTLMPAAIAWISSALQVVPVQGNLVLHKQCHRYYTNPYKCIEYWEPTTCHDCNIPDEHLAEAGGKGVSNADFIVYVTSKPTQGNTLAYAGSCQYDQNDRPIAGAANFGEQHINVAEPGSKDFDYQLGTVIHELFHALGFSSDLFDNFRDASGNKRAGVVKEFNERGHTVKKITTPNVLKYAGEHFGCPSINGVELENQGGSGTVGSHWEKRLLNEEFMTGVQIQNDDSIKTKITLALMEDSGWYKSNYNAAEVLKWGKGEGCKFVTEPCLKAGNPPTSLDSDYFCVKDHQQGCTVGRHAKATCSIANWSSDLPPEYRYFPDPTMGGDTELLDFCPIFTPYSTSEAGKGSMCIYPENLPSTNYWGESYGTQARCFLSTLQDESYTRYYVNPGSTCHTYRCNNNKLEVMIGQSWVACPPAGGKVTTNGFRGDLTCPAASDMCS